MTLFDNPARHGAALMIAAGAMFACVNTMLQYVTMRLGLASPTATFWQYAIALIVLLPWQGRDLSALRTARLPAHILRVAFAVGGVQLWTMGLAHVPIWQAISLIMLSPFFVTIGAAVLLGERVTVERWAAVVAGFIGGAVILSPWSDAFTVWAFAPVGAAALWAASSLMTKRMTATESPATLTLYLLALLTPLNLALTLTPGAGLAISGAALAALAVAGLLTAAAQYALARAYSIADAAFLQPFDHIKLPFNVGLGIITFGFVPPGSMWIGSALIVGASLWLLSGESRRA
ncbi:DMT family transporter [Paracoccus sp. (in: a-proteobacteria)]|uniref:DMT family transporter n=1 Tax=Paracoccus sp. TaxID=267 RepID=UPI0026DF27FF|nr:DMT family transporter [Paracoccus sp. (in: a-proteobacteria)]MDO5648512.1 DMT family transporter [Paracoccus sp. (in: a-proteobacteria)]